MAKLMTYCRADQRHDQVTSREGLSQQAPPARFPFGLDQAPIQAANRSHEQIAWSGRTNRARQE